MECYTLDPFLITMDRFYDLTLSKRLSPGRIPLQENMEERFQLLINAGIGNLGELSRSLNSKQNIGTTASTTGIPENYLILLRREAGSYLARPFPLSDFPGIPFEYVEVLRSKAIKHTKDFFELVQTIGQRQEIAKKTGIPEVRLKEIFVLCSLSRISGFGGVFARIVYEAGFRSVEDFVKAESSDHIEKYRAIIKKHGYAAGNITEEDMRYCLDYAKVIEEFTNKDGRS